MGDEGRSLDEIIKTLGKTIRHERKNLHLSQTKLADGICSQAMISSIEKGDYIPNAILLGKICKRLNISVDHVMLMNYLEINQLDYFNKKIKELCENHQYNELLDYIAESNVLAKIERNEDFQTYYYYYGCAIYQATKNYSLAKRYLKMSLDYTWVSETKNVRITSAELLLFSCLGVVYTDLKNNELALDYFNKAYHYISQDKVLDYTENINSFFYQYGFALTKMNDIPKAIQIVNYGISFASEHQSHYMMANMFFLLSDCYEKVNDDVQAGEAYNNYNVIEKIFHDKVYKLDQDILD